MRNTSVEVHNERTSPVQAELTQAAQRLPMLGAPHGEAPSLGYVLIDLHKIRGAPMRELARRSFGPPGVGIEPNGNASR